MSKMSIRVNRDLFTNVENDFLSALSDKYHYIYKGERDNSVWIMPGLYTYNEMQNITDLCSSFDGIQPGKCVRFSKSKPVLDEVEEAYLKNFIKPFKQKIISISKRKENNDYARLIIKYETYNFTFDIEDVNTLELPEFKSDIMYIGVPANEEFTLSDLGI